MNVNIVRNALEQNPDMTVGEFASMYNGDVSSLTYEKKGTSSTNFAEELVESIQ